MEIVYDVQDPLCVARLVLTSYPFEFQSRQGGISEPADMRPVVYSRSIPASGTSKRWVCLHLHLSETSYLHAAVPDE